MQMRAAARHYNGGGAGPALIDSRDRNEPREVELCEGLLRLSE
jgi:hypothetical protein